MDFNCITCHQTSLDRRLTPVEGISTNVKQQQRFEETFFVRYSWIHVDCIVISQKIFRLYVFFWKIYFLETRVDQIHIWRYENVWIKTLWIPKGAEFKQNLTIFAYWFGSQPSPFIPPCFTLQSYHREDKVSGTIRLEEPLQKHAGHGPAANAHSVHGTRLKWLHITPLKHAQQTSGPWHKPMLYESIANGSHYSLMQSCSERSSCSRLSLG